MPSNPLLIYPAASGIIETVRLMEEIAEVIEAHGSWPIG